MTTLGVTLDQWEDDFEEAFYLGCGLNLFNWKALLADQVRVNATWSMYSREAAITLLKAARTLGCRAKKGPLSNQERTSPGFYRFLDLPPELKLHVLRQLDERPGLTERQFLNVVSFACDPTTIGYGQPDFDWSGLLNGLAGEVGHQGSSLSPTLPAVPWNWNDCFTHRAPPRDWSADLMDASDDFGERAARTTLPKPGYSRYRPNLFAFFESTQTQHWEW
uniref:Uncharacterized protein n=2 Tax=Kalmanozyma brasiliensis (strain GHG001) TaxID=1365824 RepID=V5EMQ8_KALBG